MFFPTDEEKKEMQELSDFITNADFTKPDHCVPGEDQLKDQYEVMCQLDKKNYPEIIY